jgi:3-oxoacyl-[acyl-carrier-protein] synthase II
VALTASEYISKVPEKIARGDGSRRRVAVTGIGVLSSIGIGKDTFWESLRAGRSGIDQITLFDARTFPVRIGGEVQDFDPHIFFPSDYIRRLDRYALMGLAAAKMALLDAELKTPFIGDDTRKACVRMGTVIGALAHAEETHSVFLEKGSRRVSPFFSSLVLPSSLATQVAIMCNVHGSVGTIIGACASGTSAVGDAFRLIREGKFDIAIAGASDTPITPLVFTSFATVGLLASDNDSPSTACRPFSRNRAGIVLAEGAATLILEEFNRARERGAKIYGEILGYGESFDAYHTHHPVPSGEYCAEAMSAALRDADVHPTDIDYINPHGSGSSQNDRAETLAIKNVFGEHAYKLSASSTKSMTGHTLGACGAIELVACMLMLEQKFLHPTINLIEKDPECDLDFIPNVGRNRAVQCVLSSSSGFGGYNAACVIAKV